MKNDLRNASITGGQFGNNNTMVVKVGGGKKPPKITYRPDQIGGDSPWQGYIHYLIKKEVEAQKNSGWDFSFQKVHTQIEKEFGNKTFMLPLEKAPLVAEFLKAKIDQTRFVRGLNHKFYHSFEEHSK